ncbi:hypothetical protein AB0J09_45510, partial [Nonomuraea sp. NPDC049784]
MSAAPKITALRGGHVSLASAVDTFLATPRTASPNTHRAYASAIDRVIDRLARDRLPAEVADDEIGQALAALWGASSPGLPAVCQRRRQDGDSPVSERSARVDAMNGSAIAASGLRT